jgi:hypothetical protein
LKNTSITIKKEKKKKRKEQLDSVTTTIEEYMAHHILQLGRYEKRRRKIWRWNQRERQRRLMHREKRLLGKSMIDFPPLSPDNISFISLLWQELRRER